MPLAAAAGIAGVAAAVTLPQYLARRNAAFQLARVDKMPPAVKGVLDAPLDVKDARRAGGPEVVSANGFGEASVAPEPARPAPAGGQALGETVASDGLVVRKVQDGRDQFKANFARDLGSIARAESSAARPRAVAGEAAPGLALGVTVPTPAAGGRAAGGMGGGGGGMGGMGGGMADASVVARNDRGSRGAAAPATGVPADRGETALRSDLAARTAAPVDSSRSMARAEQAAEGEKLGRTVAEGFGAPSGRQPAVVGTQGAGIANYQPNANGAAPPGLAVPPGQPAQGQVAGNNQPGQPGQNALLMKGAQQGVYYYDTGQANASNTANPAQQAQGAANNMVPSIQNQGTGNQRPGGQTQFSVDFGLAQNARALAESRNQYGVQPGQSPMANGSQGQQQGQAQPATNLTAGLDVAQQIKPAAAMPALQPGQGVAFAPAASAPIMPAPIATPPMPAPAAVASAANVDAFDAVEMLKSPAAGPAAPAGKPAQAVPEADKKLMAKEKVQFEGQKDLAAAAEPAQAPAKVASGLQDLAKAPVQLAVADEAAKARGEEELREIEGKRAEIRQLAEQAEGLRRQVARQQTKFDRESYARFYDHPFLSVLPGNELSTFAIDVDTGSYANCRRFLAQGQLPPPDAVRIEELLNYFRYDDAAPKGDEPFSVNCEVAACPWDAGHRLARVGLKGKTIELDKRPPSNLVFLIDVSGSMADLNKLPLLKAGMKLLVEQLTENDRVGIVTYSNDVKEAFPSTPCHRKAEILAAIDALQAGGGTNGGAGIQAAYGMAEKNYLKGGGTNRVILATDGDFNVGMTKEELLATSEARAKSGIFLTVIGFGEGNLQEAFMEQLADKGNGHYLYIDTIDEARKTLVRDLSGTLVAIAKDVKCQVEFNPDRCSSYRLIGYENRVMEAQDFRDDRKDAGEIGAGHSVTALYEIVPTGAVTKLAQADRPLKYRRSKGDAVADREASPELFTVYLRYKQPDGDKASEISRGVVDDGRDFGRASTDLKFSASVAGFGMLLRGSPYKGSLTYPAVMEIASSSLGSDPNGDRKGFLELIRQAEQAEGVEPPK